MGSGRREERNKRGSRVSNAERTMTRMQTQGSVKGKEAQLLRWHGASRMSAWREQGERKRDSKRLDIDGGTKM